MMVDADRRHEIGDLRERLAILETTAERSAEDRAELNHRMNWMQSWIEYWIHLGRPHAPSQDSRNLLDRIERLSPVDLMKYALAIGLLIATATGKINMETIRSLFAGAP